MDTENMNLQERLRRGMYNVEKFLIEKILDRMERETRLSRKTLKMISQAEKLFVSISSWSRF